MNIEEAINILTEYKDTGVYKCKLSELITAIDTVLKELEQEKEKNKELQNYMKEYLIPKSTIKLVYISKDKIKKVKDKWNESIKWNNSDDWYYAMKMFDEILDKE